MQRSASLQYYNIEAMDQNPPTADALLPLFVQILIVQKTLFDWTTQISLNPKGGRKDRQ